MGEQAFRDRRVHRPISLPRSDIERPSVGGTRRGASCVRALLVALACCLTLASCATSEHGIAARRDREAEKLSQTEVWRSDAATIDPEVMPAPPRKETPKPAQGAAAGASQTESAPEAVMGEVLPPRAIDTARGKQALFEDAGSFETVALAAEAGHAGAATEHETAGDMLDIPDDELMRELLLRKLKRWENQAGGYSHASNLSPDDEEQQLARDLVTLGFLSDGQALDETGLEAAAITLSHTGDREDLLRAALVLQRLGRTDESRDLLRRFAGDEGGQHSDVPGTGATDIVPTVADAAAAVEVATPAPAPAASTSNEKTTFDLVSVTFASRIDGPGDFVAMPAEEIRPGKEVLVYGEFAGFRTIEYRGDAGDQPTHSRAFSASLRLEDAETATLEELKFLPPSRGRQFVDNPGEAVNFWARYQIPEDLDAGDYRIVINAEDHFGGQSATAALPFHVR